MREVLLLDDEYLVRERLKRAVDWEAYGFRIAGEAENGEDGLALLDQLKVDLAIVDINMPIVDGLEFARLASSRYPGLRMAILTGYGTFDYAQAAIRAGARDYLLKPIDRDEFKALLARMEAELRKESEEQERLRDAIRESESIVRDRWVREWLDGAIPWEAEQFGKYCPTLAGKERYVVLAAAADKEDGCREDGDGAVRDREVVGAVEDAMATAGFRLGTGGDAEGRRTWVVGLDGEGAEEALARICRAALSFLGEEGFSRASVGMSDPFDDWVLAPEAARQASYALAYRTLRGGGRLLRHGELNARPLVTKGMSVRDRMLILLRLGNEAAVAGAIDEWMAEYRAPDASLEQFCLLLGELAAAFSLYASERRLEADGIVPASLQPFELAWSLGSLERIREWLRGQSALLLGRAAGEPRRATSLLAEKAKEYIDREFADPELDLNVIAGAISVNSSYLSRVFKQETGCTVIEYVTLCRMARAKELLERGVRNLSYVSEAVGYSDALYFSKCFKKLYGVPPSRFAGMPN